MRNFFTSGRRARAAIAIVASGAALAGFANPASAQTVRGTVVHHNARAHSFVIAAGSGRLYAVHARRLPRIGMLVTVGMRRLRNGTFALQHERVLRRGSRRVRVLGTVSYVNRRAGMFTISAPGVSMLVRTSRRMARSADALPAVGTDVAATGTVDDQGDLENPTVQTQGTDTGAIQIEGTIISVDTTNRTLTVSADDSEQSGATLTVDVPSSLDITQFAANQEVELNVTPQSDGTYMLLGSASDDNAQQANNGSDAQGNNQGEDGQGDQSGSSNGSSSSSGDGSSTGSDQGSGSGAGSGSGDSGGGSQGS